LERKDQLVNRVNKDLTTASVLILGERSTRLHAIFINQSDSVAYLQLGAAVAANEGIRLNALGGSYEINALNPYYGAVYAISAGTTKRLSAVEVYFP